VYRRILGPVYDDEKENWTILPNKVIYASVLLLLNQGPEHMPQMHCSL
jgi:hypothetical protein